jgi:SAM-dependent methyltransferase
VDASVYEDFEQREDSHWWFAARREVLERVLRTRVRPPIWARLLDIGCGTGAMLPMLARFGAVEAVEGSPDALERARRRFPQFTIHGGDLPGGLPVGEWEVLTCFDVLEHLDAPVEALVQMKERMAHGGALLVTVPAFPFLWSEHDELTHHRRRYTRSTLRAHLEAAGLTLEWMSFFNTWLFPAVAGVRLAQKALRLRTGQSDLNRTGALADAVLRRVFASERHLLSRASLPFGVSLVAVARS